MIERVSNDMKKKRVRGTFVTPYGTFKDKHEIVDPLPDSAASAEELLGKFMGNLIEHYNQIIRTEPFAAERYVKKHLQRLRHSDPETGKECTPEQQEDFQERLLKMFYRLLRETEETGGFNLEIKDKRSTDS
jgi:hypothetical protein